MNIFMQKFRVDLQKLFYWVTKNPFLENACVIKLPKIKHYFVSLNESGGNITTIHSR